MHIFDQQRIFRPLADLGTDRERAQRFFALVRQLAAKKLADQTKHSDLTTSDVPGSEGLLFAPWMGLIVLSGPKVKTTFKVHFASEHKAILLGDKRQECSQSLFLDAVKEYCNQVSGGIKTLLGLDASQLGSSLPLVTRGFDEVLMMNRILENQASAFRDVWALSRNRLDLGLGVVCSCEAQFLAMDVLSNLRETAPLEEEGDIEFI